MISSRPCIPERAFLSRLPTVAHNRACPVIEALGRSLDTKVWQNTGKRYGLYSGRRQFILTV